MKNTTLPPLPRFPISRIIKEGGNTDCPNCHSTVERRPWLFGKKYCINKDCYYNVFPINKKNIL